MGEIRKETNKLDSVSLVHIRNDEGGLSIKEVFAYT